MAIERSISFLAMLATQPLNPPTDASRLVLAHGFTQNARCWGDFGERCAEGFDVVAVDAPGHGQSGHDTADLNEAAQLLLEVGGHGHYLGYSMGGRMLLHAALNDPKGQIKSLILVGATPGIEDDEVRKLRYAEDLQLADRIELIGTEAFIDEWLAKPLFADLSPEAASRSKRLENMPDGLATSLRRCGTGTQVPLWGQLASITVPVLVIAGSSDAKFTAIGERMVETIGSNARFVAIDGGHAVHMSNPTVTASVVTSWGEQLG